MKPRLLVILLGLMVLSIGSAWAGNSGRIGTAGAHELQIPVGARGTSMGGAVVANTEGVEAICWNPAGLAYLEGTEAMFTYLSYIADIDVSFAGAATRIEEFGTVGASARVVSVGDIKETTQQAPDGTGRYFNPTFAVVGVTYAKTLTARVSFGVSGMFIHEDIFGVTANGVAFDVGFLYDPGWRGLSLGVAIRNYGPEMRFSGRNFERELEERRVTARSAPFDLPSSVNMGVAYKFIDDGPNLATVSGNFRSNNYYEDYYQWGAEYTYDGRYSLRAGYNISEEDNYLYGLSLGGGVKFSLAGTDLTVEYSWTETDVFDDNQYFTLKAHF